MSLPSKKNQILWLRIAFWVGIVVDAIGAVMMLYPQLYARFSSVPFESDAGFFYAQRNHVALMIGWTVLLIWADRKPLERRDIALITLLVILGYTAFLIYTITIGLAPLDQSVDELVREAFMIALYAFGYLNSGRSSTSE